MIYCADISKLMVDVPFWQPFLSLSRIAKIESCNTEEKAKQSLGVELLLCYGLHQEFGLNDFPLDYKKTDTGKPYFEDKDIHFSLSHSGRYVACGISSQPIGIDLQTHTAKDKQAIEKTFTKNQLDMIKLMPPQKQKTAVYDFWTLKESVIKCLGKGSLRSPMEFEFHNAGGRLGITFEDFILNNYAILPNCSLGVCSKASLSPYIFNLSVDKMKKELCELINA